MNRILWWVGGTLWFAGVFVLVFLLTFPSERAARRLSYEVGQRTAGAYLVQAASVSPWWIGLRATNVIVSTADRSGLPDAVPTPVFFGEDVGVHVGLMSILRRTYAFTGYLVLGGSPLDFVVRTVPKDDRMSVRALEVSGQGVPLADLLGLIPGAGGTAGITGNVDVDVDLAMGQGLDKADGDISIQGRGLVIDTVTVATLGWQDREVGANIDELDLRVRIDEGKGDVVRAVVATSLAEVDLDGTITFSEAIERSRIELEVKGELRDWADTPLASFRSLVEQLIASARWADSSYHWSVDSSLGRFSVADFRPAYEASRTTPRPTVSSPYRPPTPPVAPTSVPTTPTVAPVPVAQPPVVDDEPIIEDDEEIDPLDDEVYQEEGDEPGEEDLDAREGGY